MRALLFALLLALLPVATGTETGELNGAQFRIDVPVRWNGALIMYCHGYNAAPGRFEGGALHPALTAFLNAGYAIAQSGYAAGGWAVAEAMQDTEALRRYFTLRHGPPKETWIMGHSMGGLLTAAILESFPLTYEGGLALCGPLAPAYTFFERAFDALVVFDYYFPGALPSAARVPADYVVTAARNQGIEKLLASRPAQAELVRRYTRIRTDKDLAGVLVFLTYVMKDLQQRSGGNPFDNTSTVYGGSGDDNVLNDGVKRYTADPGARAYLRRFYTPTGLLSRPLLAMHTTYDPLVPPSIPNQYRNIAADAARTDLFVQRYVKRDGHCAFRPEDAVQGFEELRRWRQTGKRPRGGGATPVAPSRLR